MSTQYVSLNPASFSPLPEDLICPVDFVISVGSLIRLDWSARLGFSETLIANAGIWLEGRFVTERGTEFLRLRWCRAAETRSMIVPRSTISDARRLLTLADSGAPVHSRNCQDLVEFLAAFEAANLHLLPPIEATEDLCAEAALEFAIAWAVGHGQSFVGREFRDGKDQGRMPPSGWSGRWGQDGDLMFLTYVLRPLLQKAGFAYDVVLRHWRTRGWLSCSDGHLTKFTRFGNDRARVVAIRRATIDARTR